MKKLLIILLFFNSTSLEAQTQKETEDWLVYNLARYFSTDYSGNNRLLFMSKKKEYIYYNHEYSFNGKYLDILSMRMKYDTSGKQTLEDQRKDKIDLTRVIKVEQDSRTTEQNSFFTISIELVFAQPRFENGKAEFRSVRTFDAYEKEIIDKSYRLRYQIFSSDVNALENNLSGRIQKAIEHLSALHGAKIIKEIF